MVAPAPGQVLRMDTAMPDGGAPIMARVSPISVVSSR
jgi:hypothetical protein